MEAIVVSQQSYESTDPTIESQVGSLASSGAQCVLHRRFAQVRRTGRPQGQEHRRKPLRLVPQCRKLAKSALEPGGLDISTGVITAQYVKDPTDPQWDNDPEINSWRALMDK